MNLPIDKLLTVNYQENTLFDTWIRSELNMTCIGKCLKKWTPEMNAYFKVNRD